MFPRMKVVILLVIALHLLLASPASSQSSPSDITAMKFWKHHLRVPLLDKHDVWVFELDFDGNGVPDIFISDAGADIFGSRREPRRGWIGYLMGPGESYTPLSSGFGWDPDGEGFFSSALAGLSVPALIIPIQGNLLGTDGKYHDAMRYWVTYLDQSTGWLRPSWIEQIYPDKSQQQLTAMVERAKANSIKPKPYQVRLEDLAKKYHIMVYDDVNASYTDESDPHYRWIGPGLPKEGVPIPWQKGAYMPAIASKVLRDALASSGTLSSASPTTGTMTSAHPTTLTKSISATSTPTRRPPLPATPTPATVPAASAPRESESHIPRILIAGGVALVVLGGVFVYSRRRR